MLVKWLILPAGSARKNGLFCSKFCSDTFNFSSNFARYPNSQDWKQCLCKILEWPTKRYYGMLLYFLYVIVFSVVVNSSFLLLLLLLMWVRCSYKINKLITRYFPFVLYLVLILLITIMHIISVADFSPILLENALFCSQNACFKNRDSN